MNPKLYMTERENLEKGALDTVCACWYYDLADSIGSTSDEELQAIVASGVPCDSCLE